MLIRRIASQGINLGYFMAITKDISLAILKRVLEDIIVVLQAFKILNAELAIKNILNKC